MLVRYHLRMAKISIYKAKLYTLMKYKNIINVKYESLARFVKDLPHRYDTEGLLIYDSRNKVRIFDIGGEKIVVKRFRRPSFYQRIDYTFFRPSKAKRAYQYGLKLLSLGISTPEPIACVEEYKCGLFYQGYFISAFCGDPDARVLREGTEGHEDLVDSLAHFYVNMHQKGFLHGDTNLSNFLYKKDEKTNDYHITTIDVNRSHFLDNPSRGKCLYNLMRVTHVRPTLEKIVQRYSELRGWDAEDAIRYVTQKLEAFERKKELHRKMKKKIKF